MSHYVCTGSCNGENKEQDVCESEFCSKEGKPLVPCDCEDGLHNSVGGKDISETLSDDLL